VGEIGDAGAVRAPSAPHVRSKREGRLADGASEPPGPLRQGKPIARGSERQRRSSGWCARDSRLFGGGWSFAQYDEKSPSTAVGFGFEKLEIVTLIAYSLNVSPSLRRPPLGLRPAGRCTSPLPPRLLHATQRRPAQRGAHQNRPRRSSRRVFLSGKRAVLGSADYRAYVLQRLVTTTANRVSVNPRCHSVPRPARTPPRPHPSTDRQAGGQSERGVDRSPPRDRVGARARLTFHRSRSGPDDPRRRA
jgi:hypothetical protein